jgi:hypothetical protein
MRRNAMNVSAALSVGDRELSAPARMLIGRNRAAAQANQRS